MRDRVLAPLVLAALARVLARRAHRARDRGRPRTCRPGLVLWFLSLLAVGLDGLVQGLGAVFGAASLPVWLPGAAKAIAPIGGLLLILLAWASGSPTFEALPGFTRDWLRNAAAQGMGLRQRTRTSMRVRWRGSTRRARPGTGGSSSSPTASARRS